MPTATEQVVDEFAADRAAVDAALRSLCDRRLATLAPPVADAIRYALLGEGKRMRPVLVLAAYRAAGGWHPAAPDLAAAVEVVHAYSLVHDDLPCMDDDDVRRGRPTTHRVHGVRVATAAGVAMVPLAAGAALDAGEALGLPAAVRADIVRELMRASGPAGMVGGQLLDLAGERCALTLGELERVHRGKTGALIAAAARVGALAAGAPESVVEALAGYGARVGLAFQITDDVLDATGTTAELGKTAGRDAVRGKNTYPALLGVEGAMERARALAAEAGALLAAAGVLTPALQALASNAVARRR